MGIFRLLKTGLLTVVILVLCLPAPLTALDAPPYAGPMGLQSTSSVIITEVQTGSSAAGKSDEFIELYNTSNEAVDITGWQLRYSNASNENATPSLIVTVALPEETAVVLPGNGYFVLRTPSVPLDVAGQTYDAKLSNADKAVMLLRPDVQTCQYVLEDAVAWGLSTRGEGSAVAVPVAEKNAERHLQRYRDQQGYYLDTNTTGFDISLAAAQTDGQKPFVSQGASPGQANGSVKYVPEPLDPAEPVVGGVVLVQDCELPVLPEDPEPPVTLPPTEEPPVVPLPPETLEPDTPAPQNIGLISPQFTEALPNPAAPQTDAADEFIELYNANDTVFYLGGYALTVGKRRYVFPENAKLDAKAFTAFFSADTKVALPNSGGMVTLTDTFGNTVASLEPYGAAKDGQAWARTTGKWVWTTSPTPNAVNSIAVPQPKKKAAAPAKTATAAATARPKAQTGPQDASVTSVASITPETPIHGSILVLIGVFAVLYGAYEYRHDVRNYFYRFRSHRAARAEIGSKPEGRRDN